MSPVSSTLFAHTLVSTRHALARRPRLYWLVVGLLGLATAVTVSARIAAVDAERATWGEQTTVWVTTRSLAPGDLLGGAAEQRTIPAAIAPPGAFHGSSTDSQRDIARQHVGLGEIVVDTDIAPSKGRLALVPEGWLAMAVVELIPSGAEIGATVQLVSDGVVLSTNALVVGRAGEAILLATPADIAPLIPAAAAAGGVSLLLAP